MTPYHQEEYTPEEQAVLRRFFTNLDLPVFGLINLPEVVKGALFARYSRSAKSLRRLFLDEFVADPDSGMDAMSRDLDDDPLVATRKAEELYQRVFFDYGDDSVAQLGGAHLACEQASNLLTKVLEWGRLAAYLEQSTRYIRYDAKLGDRYRYFVPPEISESHHADRYLTHMERVFDAYSSMVATMIGHFEQLHPRGEDDSAMVWNATIRAKACDTVRGLLPISTLSNVGIYGTGQAYEMSLVRMRAHPLREVQAYGDMMLGGTEKIIPSFLTRVDLEDRGMRWSSYLEDVRSELEDRAASLGATLGLRAVGDAGRLGSRGGGESRRRRPLRSLRTARPTVAPHGAIDDRIREGGPDCLPRRRPGEPTAQTGASHGAHHLPIRCHLRHRRFPRPPASPPHDPRMAALHHPARL